MRDQIISHARTVRAEDYSYTRTIRAEQTSNEKTETSVIVERWDPTKNGDQRWSFVSVDGRAPNAKELADYTKGLARRRPAFYGRVAGYFAQTPKTSTDSLGRTVFKFTSLPKETVTIGETDLSASATAEATVNSSGTVPFFEEVRFRSTKPARIKLIAKVEQFESSMRYRLLPDGKPVPSEFVSEMRGSMLGQSGRIRTKITYSDHRAVTP